MTLSKRERYIAAAAILILAALAADRLLLSPLFGKQSRLTEQKLGLQEELARAEAAVAQKTATEARWNQMLADGLYGDAEATESMLLHAIREWAQDAGLTLVSVRPERPVEKKGTTRQVLAQVVGTGPYGSVTRFLWLLQNAPQPVKLAEMQLSSRREGMDDLSLQLRLSALYLPGGANPVAAAPATAAGGDRP